MFGNRIAASCAVACMGIGMSVTACASVSSADSRQLNTVEVTRIAQICESVMGLDPKEPLVWGIHTGAPGLDSWTSHYRGCVASLSDSAQTANARHAVDQADRECRAKGYEPGTPDLAVCVLRSSEAQGNRTATQVSTAAAVLSGRGYSARATSFYDASNRTISRRERLACAELGLEPGSSQFEGCVRELKATFFAIDNPVT